MICIGLIVSYNDYQKSAFLSSSNALCGGIYNVRNSIGQYFDLRAENDQLSAENAELHNKLATAERLLSGLADSTRNDLQAGHSPKYRYRTAYVINSSTNKSRNYLTANIGSVDGVAQDMVVRNSQGVVGIISAVSEHYSTILPIINTSFRLSVKLLNNNFRGQLQWNSVSPLKAQMIDVPEHAEVAIGDTIVTSGASNYFPEGMLVGVVENIGMDKNGGFYRLEIALSTDFYSIYDVEIIENLELSEQKELEQSNGFEDE